jgi:hypothetical protein
MDPVPVFILGPQDADIMELAQVLATHPQVTVNVGEKVFQPAIDRSDNCRNAMVWIGKPLPHTKTAVDLAIARPEARFICLSKGNAESVRSLQNALNTQLMAGHSRWKTILRNTITGIYHQKLLSRFTTVFHERVCNLDFRAFQARDDATIEYLLGFLGVASDPRLVGTSRRKSVAVADVCFSPAERAAVVGLEYVSGFVPFSLLDAGRTLFVRHRLVNSD